MAELNEEIDSMDDTPGAYSEAILVKKAILRKKYDIIFYMEKFDLDKLNGIVSPGFFNQWKVNLFSLYRLLDPMMFDKYKEDFDKINPTMEKLMYDVNIDPMDSKIYYNADKTPIQRNSKPLDVTELYDITRKIFYFIKKLGITDLEIKDQSAKDHKEDLHF